MRIQPHIRNRPLSQPTRLPDWRLLIWSIKKRDYKDRGDFDTDFRIINEQICMPFV